MAGHHPAGDNTLIDDYLAALRHDPDAPPPHGLDPQTADFVRRLAQAESAPTRLGPGQQARIWHKALELAANPGTQPRSARSRFIRLFNRSGVSPMLASPQVRQSPGIRLTVPGVLLPFAAAVLVVLLAALISRFTPTGPSSGNGSVPPLGAGDNQAQRASATPTPAPTQTITASPIVPVLPTGTPFAPVLPVPMVTPTVVAPFDMATPSPFPPTVVPPGYTMTATPFLVPEVTAERALSMNSTSRDELTAEQPIVTYRLPVEQDGWIAVAIRPDDPALDLTLRYDLAQPDPAPGAPSGGGGGGAGGGPLPLDEIGVFSFARSGSILSLTVGANNIHALGRAYFTVSVYQGEPVSVRVAQAAEAALSSDQQVAMFIVEASDNQLVDINVESDGGADLYLNVLEMGRDVEMSGHIYRGPITGCFQGQPLFCMDQDGGLRRDPELTDVTLLEGRRYLLVVRALDLNAESEFTLTISPR